jgi:ligand-binding sensor domain-containing protein/signal transduction histidine kinase
MSAHGIAVLIFALLPSLAAADSAARNEYSHSIWRIQDGLPQNSIQAITQTTDGYLWIGTPEGLVRFDGARFVVFDRANTPAFQDDSILTLRPAPDGSLWIGSEGGGLLHYRNGTFRSFGAKDGLTNGFIRSIYIDRGGTLWVGADRGFFRMSGDRFVRLDGTPEIPLASVLSIAEDADLKLWVATQSQLLWVDRGTLVKSPCRDQSPIAQAQSLYSAPDGTLWLLTTSGANRLQNGCGIPEHGLPRVAINALHHDAAGNLWIGTVGQGLYRVTGGILARYQAPSVLPDNTVTAIFEDRERNLWIGSRDGLLRLSPTAVSTLGEKDGLADSNVLTVYEDPSRMLWIVTLTGQLYRFDGRRLERFQGLPSNTDLSVRTVYQDRAGALWIGTNRAGAIRMFQGRTVFYSTSDGLRSNSIRQFFEDRAGRIWIATGSGLALWDGHQIRNYYLEDGLSYPSVRSIAAGPDGDILAGTDGGVSRIHDLHIVPDPLLAQLNREKIWAIHYDAKGALWLGTRGGGLFRIHDGKIFHYSTREGLLNDSIFQILEGKADGRLWLSTPTGVFSIARAELDAVAGGKPGPVHAVPYGASEGMESSHMNGGTQPAGCITASGELWFPSIRGVVRIDPAQVRSSQPMPVLIERIVAGGRSIPLAPDVTIPAGRGALQIDFTACYLLAPQRVIFKYKLEGLDDDWNLASKVRSASYINVPPGHYRFRVMAGDSGDPGQVSEASTALTWSPAFYQTSVFYALCFAAAVLVGWAGLSFYTHEAKARYAVLLNERIRLAREMHDTIIQGCVGVSTLLEAASRFQRTDRDEANRLLDQAKIQVKSTLEEAREAVWNLRHASVGQNAITTLSELAGKLGKENGMKIETEIVGPRQPLEPGVDRTLLLVAREALRNAVSHSSAGQILMRISFQPSELCLEVTDDGRGFESPCPASGENGHFGILGMRERVEQLGGVFHLASNPGAGTVVTVRLPMNYSSTIPR